MVVGYWAADRHFLTLHENKIVQSLNCPPSNVLHAQKSGSWTRSPAGEKSCHFAQCGLTRRVFSKIDMNRCKKMRSILKVDLCTTTKRCRCFTTCTDYLFNSSPQMVRATKDLSSHLVKQNKKWMQLTNSADWREDREHEVFGDHILGIFKENNRVVVDIGHNGELESA